MYKEKLKVKIENSNIPSIIEGRIAIALDTSVWFNLAEFDNEQIKRVKTLLNILVENGKIFCPLTFSGISELLRRNYENAKIVAELMDKLSLGISFTSNNEIYYREIERFLLNALKKEDATVFTNDIYSPVMAWLGSNLNFHISTETFQSIQEKEKMLAVTNDVTEQLFSMKVSDLVNLIKNKLPLPKVIQQPNYDWKKRWEENKGNKNKLGEIEKQYVLKRILNEIIKETDSDKSEQSFLFKMTVINYMNSLPKDKDGTYGSAILEKMPAHKNMIEVMTFVGFDPNRIDTINDFYDIDFMIIPMTYADVVVATDKWIRNLITSYGKNLHKNSAKYIGTWNELENYLNKI